MAVCWTCQALFNDVFRFATELNSDAGAAHGIECTLVTLPGKHDWPSAAHAFAVTLPWIAGRLHTPGVPEVATP